jgi:hypothetical protein
MDAIWCTKSMCSFSMNVIYVLIGMHLLILGLGPLSCGSFACSAFVENLYFPVVPKSDPRHIIKYMLRCRTYCPACVNINKHEACFDCYNYHSTVVTHIQFFEQRFCRSNELTINGCVVFLWTLFMFLSVDIRLF